MTLRPSPHWRLVLESGDRLVLLAGADEVFLLDEATGESARALYHAFCTDTLGALPPALAPLLALLERAGAVVRAMTPPATLRWSIVSQGPAEALCALISAFADKTPGLVRVEQDAELVLAVRAGGALMAFAEALSTVTAPHVLIDAAYDHTLSLGPLVWPGETACLSCFAGRIRHAWGDPAPPEVPRVMTSPEAAAAHAVGLLRRFQREGALPELSGRTVSIDLNALTARADAVHRLPWCPRCHPDPRPHSQGFYPLEELTR